MYTIPIMPYPNPKSEKSAIYGPQILGICRDKIGTLRVALPNHKIPLLYIQKLGQALSSLFTVPKFSIFKALCAILIRNCE